MASVMICTPCYGKLVGTGYLASLIQTMNLMSSKGHRVEVHTLGNESLITRARNNLVARFLASDFDKLMFIDADITWPAQAALDLVESGKPVCGIPYPTKSFDWDRVAKLVSEPRDKPFTSKELRDNSLIFTVNPIPGAKEKKGWIEVEALGTGFLLIDRAVLEQMRDHYREELAYTNDVAYYVQSAPKEHCVAVFECMIAPDTKRYLSEDYAFCRRWRDIGGSIHCLTKHRLTHTGAADF